MRTIVTRITLRPGTEAEWDTAMRERLAAVHDRPGWVGGQLLAPIDQPNQRLIVGTWRSQADWEAWHNDPTFTDTRTRLNDLEAGPREEAWHDVVVDARHR